MLQLSQTFVINANNVEYRLHSKYENSREEFVLFMSKKYFQAEKVFDFHNDHGTFSNCQIVKMWIYTKKMTSSINLQDMMSQLDS